MAQTEKQKADKEKCRIITPEFRVSYPHVFKAQAPSPKDAKKFSVTMLFPKTADLSTIKEAMKQAKLLKYGSKENWPEDLISPVNNGDDPKFEGKEGYKGHWAIKASTSEDNRPGVVDEDGEPILDASKFYPGCYARACVFAYCWEYMGKEGVGFILDHVQKLNDGDSFGGKKSAEQVFGPVRKKSKPAEDEDEMDFR